MSCSAGPRSLYAEDSQLAYFVTAMVMAALFEPIKRRIDAFMER